MFIEFINNLANLEAYVTAENFATVSVGERALFGCFMLVVGISTTFIALLIIQLTINTQAYFLSGEKREPKNKSKKVKPIDASNHLASINSGEDRVNSATAITPRGTAIDDKKIVAAITAAIVSICGKDIVVKKIVRGRKANISFPERY